MDVDALPDLEVALEKLELLFLALSETDGDHERLAEPGWWEGLIECHFSDYSMQYFLSTAVADDGEWKYRVAAFSGVLRKFDDSLVACSGQDYALSKIEDLCDEVNRRL